MILEQKNKKDNIAIALGGGVARGAFHLGVLDFCEQHKIDIKAYSGSSIGSIISASHASGVKAKEGTINPTRQQSSLTPVTSAIDRTIQVSDKSKKDKYNVVEISLSGT